MELVINATLVMCFIVLPLTGIGFLIAFPLALQYSKYYYDGSEGDQSREWPQFRYYQTCLGNALKKNLYSFSEIYYDDDGGDPTLTTKLEKEIADVLGGSDAVIFAAHPHGILAVSSFLHVSTPTHNSLVPWSKVPLCVHRLIFTLPVVRDLALWSGMIDVSRSNLINMLDKGKSIYVVVGGAREMISREIDTKHTGLLRLAYEKGKSVYPIIHTGEDKAFRLITIWGTEWLRKFCLDLFSYPFPSFWIPWYGTMTTHIYQAHKPSSFTSVDDFIKSYYGRVKAYESSLLIGKKMI